MGEVSRPLTAYEILRVHPCAPIDLISACYWELTKDIRERRSEDADVELHALTRAYGSVSDPARREAYDRSTGYAGDSLITRPLPRKRAFVFRMFGRGRAKWSVDPHEILGLHPEAPQKTVPEAYRIMRNMYLRLAPGRRREMLLAMVDDAYSVVSDPERRADLTAPYAAEMAEFQQEVATEAGGGEREPDDRVIPSLPPSMEAAAQWPPTEAEGSSSVAEPVGTVAAMEPEPSEPDDSAEPEIEIEEPETAPPAQEADLPEQAMRGTEPKTEVVPALLESSVRDAEALPTGIDNAGDEEKGPGVIVAVMSAVASGAGAVAAGAWGIVSAAVGGVVGWIGGVAGGIADAIGRRQARREEERELRARGGPPENADDLFLGRLASSVGDAESHSRTREQPVEHHNNKR